MSNSIGIDFNSEIKLLKERGPDSLYLIYGIEDYLRDIFISEIRSICVIDTAFGYYLFDDIPDKSTLSSSIDTMPFISDRSLIEIRNCNVNKISEEILDVLKDIPEYCTILLICQSDYELDNRTKAVKYLKNTAKVMNFTSQEDSKLISWVIKRFNANGKQISKPAAERLLFISGDRMNALIPEINKISGISEPEVTVKHIDILANHLPEADAFEIVDLISDRKFDKAINVLSDLLTQKNMEPIMILSAFGYQFRQLFGAKIGALNGRFDFRSKATISTSRKFSKKQIYNCINICSDHEFLLKTSLFSDIDIIKTMVVKIIAEVY